MARIQKRQRKKQYARETDHAGGYAEVIFGVAEQVAREQSQSQSAFEKRKNKEHGQRQNPIPQDITYQGTQGLNIDKRLGRDRIKPSADNDNREPL